MKSDIIKNKDYAVWLKEIKAKIQSAQIKAAVHVNTGLLYLYWDLGKMIVEKQSKSKWGDGVVKQLSKDLLSEFPEMSGFSSTNLKYIRKWYQFYSRAISQQLVDQLASSLKVPQLVAQIEKSPQLVGQIKGSEDKSTIGILLCKTPNETIVKYSLQGINTPIGVSDYHLGQALPKELKGEIPSIKELEHELEREVEEFQNQQKK